MAAGQDVEAAVVADGVGQNLRGEDFLFAPDHDVFQGVGDVVFAEQPLVDRVDVVHQGDVDVGIQRGHVIEVEGLEEAVLPAEGGVGVDDDVLILLGSDEHVLEDGPAEGVEACPRQVEDAAVDDVGGLGVHHFSEVAERDIVASIGGDPADALQERRLVYADLTGDDDAAAGAFGPAEQVFGVAGHGAISLVCGCCVSLGSLSLSITSDCSLVAVRQTASHCCAVSATGCIFRRSGFHEPHHLKLLLLCGTTPG